MKTKTYLDRKQFDNYVVDLARMLNAELPEVIDSEAASVIKLTASKHKPAKAAEVRRQTRLRVMKQSRLGGAIITINTRTQEGRVWFNPDLNANGNWQIIGEWDFKSANFTRNIRRLKADDYKKSRELWKYGKTQAAAAVKIGLKSRGLSGKSWLKIIRIMGKAYQLVGPQSARISPSTPIAVARTGRDYRNERVYRTKSSRGYTLHIVNGSPTTVRNRGRRNLQRSIMQRRAFYRRNLKSGVLKTAKSASTAYPGIRVTN
ncbi:MAG: hypothetical protein AAF546_00180 [Verrucomicrobiota bacterium]